MTSETPDFNNLKPTPIELKRSLDVLPKWLAIHEAYQAGARHGYEQARQLWPEPITDRPPTEADADNGVVQVLNEADCWAVWHWESAAVQRRPWLHTPRWQPRQPSLQEQALEDVDYFARHFYGPGMGPRLDRLRRALEQAGEGAK